MLLGVRESSSVKVETQEFDKLSGYSLSIRAQWLLILGGAIGTKRSSFYPEDSLSGTWTPLIEVDEGPEVPLFKWTLSSGEVLDEVAVPLKEGLERFKIVLCRDINGQPGERMPEPK